MDFVTVLWYNIQIMSPESRAQSAERRKAIIQRSAEVLGSIPYTHGTESIIVSEQQATTLGEAVASRDHRAIRDVFGDTLDKTAEDYRATEAGECIGVWNRTIANTYGESITLHDMLTGSDERELLNIMLTDSQHTQLGMDTTEYLKLLETIAIMTMPEKGLASYPESRRSRTGGTERALFFRSISLLTACADAEPGIRSVREAILKGEHNPLSTYLGALTKSWDAQSSLATIIEMDEHEIRRSKAGLTRTILDTQTEHDIEVEDMLHVLEWKMLSGAEEDRETKHRRIKKIIEGQSVTELQKRKLYADWCPERLDFLIEIAEMGKEMGRNPHLYISNRFEEGAGVYVALELDNPHNPDKKMLFADNPLSGNALYIVDEVRLENEARPNPWQNVLGASRRIARERGAIRKYHTKNWQDILPTVMGMGAELSPKPELSTETPITPAEAPVDSAAEGNLAPTHEEPTGEYGNESIEDLIHSTRSAVERSRALVESARKLLSKQ